MPWRPSTDPRFHKRQTTPFWDALAGVFDNAFPTEPFHRPDQYDNFLASEYLIDRQGRGDYDRQALLSTIPPEFRGEHIGPTEIDLLEFLFGSSRGRVLSVVGTRGAGKTSLLNYVSFQLDKHRKPTTPFLLVMDGNRDVAAGAEEFFHQLGDQLETLSKSAGEGTLPPEVATAFNAQTGDFSAPHSRDRVLHTLERVVALLPSADPRLLVLVFDNLDPLPVRSVRAAFQLAREVYARCGAGTILCMRPSLFRKIADQGGARQFVHGYIRVYPPTLKSWLAAFPERMRAALVKMYQTSDERIAHGIQITPAVLERACQRFASLLENRRREDDPTEFLESVASQDMRQLLLLVRSMLENARLPSEWLLSESATQSDEAIRRFHPLSATMEGGYRCYASNYLVMNTLWLESGGAGNVLIFHRLLSLLADHEPKETNILLRWMDVFNYERRLVMEALNALRKGHLVYGSDLDVDWSLENSPEYCGLTDSGKYFLNTLLPSADYLLAVIMDVPLEHRAITRFSLDSFTSRLYSLMEFLKEVKERENAQITELKRRTNGPELRVVTDRLRNGGTLTAKILNGFKEAITRARNSEPLRVREVASELQSAVQEYKDLVELMEISLFELRRKAIRHDWPDEIPKLVTPSNAGSQLTADFTSVGDSFEVDLKLEIPSEESKANMGALISISDQGSDKQLGVAYLNKSEEPGDHPIATANLVGKGVWVPAPENMTATPKAGVLLIEKTGGTVGILSVVHRRTGGAQLEFCVWRDCEPLSTKKIIGEIKDCDGLCAWAEKKLKEVKQLLDRNLPIEVKLRGIGAELAEKVLNAPGRELLLQVVHEVKTCLIATEMRGIPWEWLILEASSGAKSISDLWDTIRWPPEDGTKAFHRVSVGTGAKVAQPFLTIGLVPKEDRAWYLGVPQHAGELIQWLHQGGAKHVVAHVNEEQLYVIGLDELHVTHGDLFGSPPAIEDRPDGIVLSACGAGALDDPNLAVMLAVRWCCRVWAPLTDITTTHAAAVDHYLSDQVINSKLTLPRAMREGRAWEPLLKLYVQYGVQPQ